MTRCCLTLPARSQMLAALAFLSSLAFSDAIEVWKPMEMISPTTAGKMTYLER